MKARSGKTFRNRGGRTAHTHFPIGVDPVDSQLKSVVLVGWRAAARAMRPSRISKFTESHDSLQLMIGAGPNALDGWLGTDLTPRGSAIFLDATKPFPFETGSVTRIHTEHMIEHIPFDAAEGMLAECHRVLTPGGRIRVATPDFDVFAALAEAARTGAALTDDQSRYVRESNQRNGVKPNLLDNVELAVNRMFSGHGHLCLYSSRLMITALERAGFVNGTVHAVGQSDDPAFVGVEQHGKRTDEFANDFQTLVVEAEKSS